MGAAARLPSAPPCPMGSQHQPRTSLVAGAVAVHGAGRKISRKVSLQKEAKKIKIESTQGNEAACDGYQEAR